MYQELIAKIAERAKKENALAKSICMKKLLHHERVEKKGQTDKKNENTDKKKEIKEGEP